MKVLDASFSALPAGWAAARKAEGYGAFIQCLWTGGYANNPIRSAEPNLKQVREAGMIPCGYINTNPWYPASTSIAEAKKNAGAEWAHLPIVFNDIEIAGVTEAQSKAHTEAIIAEGKRTAIYSARWFWNSIGNPQWPWLRQYGAWVADYDNDPNLATTTLFGPFTLADVVGKQYTNTTNLAGVQVDFNEFRDAFFQVAQEDDMFEQEDRDKLARIETMLSWWEHVFTPTGHENAQTGRPNGGRMIKEEVFWVLSAMDQVPGGMTWMLRDEGTRTMFKQFLAEALPPATVNLTAAQIAGALIKALEKPGVLAKIAKAVNDDAAARYKE